MKKNSNVDSINKRLRVYGVNSYGDSIFRVVFSDDQTEKRKGEFHEYYNQIFLRKYVGIKEVSKYPWIKGKWILERWAPGSLAYHPSLVIEDGKDGVYICVYVFQDVNKNYLPPVFKVAEIVVHHLLNPRSKSQALSEDAEILQKEEEQEVNQIVQDLQIQSDEVARKDKHAKRESLSIGYTKPILKVKGKLDE